MKDLRREIITETCKYTWRVRWNGQNERRDCRKEPRQRNKEVTENKDVHIRKAEGDEKWREKANNRERWKK